MTHRQITKAKLSLGLLFAIAMQTRSDAQIPNFQLLDRSVVNVDVICPPKPDDPGLDECSGRATGIVLSERDGIVRVLTARHEVHGVNRDPNARIRLTFAFDQLKPTPAKLLSISSEQLDLAVLEAELPKGAAGFGSLPLSWIPPDRVTEGMPLWVVDGTWQPLQGKFMSLTQDAGSQRVQYVCDAAKGYSGGPVFDAAGDLVAVHLRSQPDPTVKLRDGVALDAAMKWLKSIGYSADSFNRLTESTPGSGGNDSRPSVASNLRPLSSGDRGTLLYRAGRYDEARPLLAEASKAGDGHAAMILSGMYLTGQGVPVNYVEGNRLAQISAAAGNDTAMSSLASNYVSGTGVPQNYVLGAYWYRKSADLGNPIAMFGLALLFANGQIDADATSPRTPKHQAPDTDSRAVFWLQRASQAGDLRARAFLGIMYGNGRGGLAKNDGLAVQMFRSAANQGEPMGMQLLGDWYLAGRVGGQRNFDQAIFWYKRAAALGDDVSKRRLQSIAAANPGQRF